MSKTVGAGVASIVGNRYGRLTVVARNGHTAHGHTAWDCVCDCGNRLEKIAKGALSTGNTKSCGCYNLDKIRERNFKHGFAVRGRQHPLFKVWMSIRGRCNIPSATHWDSYGGRGIKCLWNSFEEFYKDMGEEYERLYKGRRSISIDRIDNDGNYCKENCRWADDKTQANNKTTNHLVTHNGQTKTLSQWQDELGIPQTRIRARLRLGYTAEEALFTKKYQYRK